MREPLSDRARVAGPAALSSRPPRAFALVIAGLAVMLALISLIRPALAHEMNPSIADITVTAERVEVVAIVSAEAWLAGVDLSSFTDTNASPQGADYDRLRALAPARLEAEIGAAWARIAPGLRLAAGGAALAPELVTAVTEEGIDPALPRQTRLTFAAELPDDDSAVTFGLAPRLGPLILRHVGAELAEGAEPYSAFLDGGALSAPLPRSGTAEVGALASFLDYVGAGFVHILPKGIDHILFVLGLFFFAMRARPLLYQVSAFTLAHTITLAAATLGLVSAPSAIVEPLIAASIAYVGIENILRPRLSRLRVAVVFGFGLLHGLGFASVLGDIGLSTGHFLASLIAFNIGVELGQITVLVLAWLALGVWAGDKPWYRARIAVPASAAIALMGLWWALDRSLL